jgi:penicillin-binding protein 1A
MSENQETEQAPEVEPSQPKANRRRKPLRWRKLFFWSGFVSLLGMATGIVFGIFVLWQGSQIEDIRKLQEHKPVLFTKVYDRNGQLIDIISAEKRIILDYEDIPESFVYALVAVEDEYFFEHIGVSPLGILAALKDFAISGDMRGASTLTQQLVKNITRDKRMSVWRKLKEQFLAVQVELRLTKEEIFAMYANEVPFGNNQFGIEAAARFYFGKSVGALTLAESATLAGIPQAPSALNPYRNPENCLRRRNIVLLRMFHEGYITREQYEETKKQPIDVVDRGRVQDRIVGAYFVDKVRNYLFEKYGEERVRTSGWDIHTTLDLRYQKFAEEAVQEGLKDVDKAMGYRAKDCPSVFKGAAAEENKDILTTYYDPTWRLGIQEGLNLRGVVMAVADKTIDVRIDDRQFRLKPENMPWLRMRGRTMNDYFKVGDVPLFKVVAREGGMEGPMDLSDDTDPPEPEPEVVVFEEGAEEQDPEAEAVVEIESEPVKEDPYAHLTLMLDQEPEIEGAFVCRDPATGDQLAVVGGYDYNRSKFNRAEQAKRQVGSAFKPVVFGAALEQGYNLADKLFDEPTLFIDPTKFYIDEYGRLEVHASPSRARKMRLGLIPKPKPYQPHNYYLRYAGLITLRQAMAQSKNIVSVKLLNSVGYDHVLDYAYRLDLGHNNLHPFPSLALGAMEMTLQDLVAAYGTFAKNGVYYESRFITMIMDSKGRVIEENLPTGTQVISPQNAYMVADCLTSVVEDSNGTAKRARKLKLNVGGKTGTTDDYTDAWFIGFTPQLSAGSWVGRDLKETIGRNRTGGNTALPIWLRFFEKILEDLSAEDFPMPEGLIRVPIDKYTGTRITTDCDCTEDDLIFEVFKKDNVVTDICTRQDQQRMKLPWYLQKRTYEYDPETDRVKPDWQMINYASQQRANAFIRRQAEIQSEQSLEGSNP